MDNSNYEDVIQPKLEELKTFIEGKEWHQFNNCKNTLKDWTMKNY
jgi:hypothetical protein